MAALTNKERIGRVLDLVAEGLGPWMIARLTGFARSLYLTIPTLGG